jgi:hypothetical protein
MRVKVCNKFWMHYKCLKLYVAVEGVSNIGTVLLCGVAGFCYAVFVYSADTMISWSHHNKKCKLNKYNIFSPSVSFGVFYFCHMCKHRHSLPTALSYLLLDEFLGSLEHSANYSYHLL